MYIDSHGTAKGTCLTGVLGAYLLRASSCLLLTFTMHRQIYSYIIYIYIYTQHLYRNISPSQCGITVELPWLAIMAIILKETHKSVLRKAS